MPSQYAIFWLEEGIAHHELESDLGVALKLCESLRNASRDDITHVVISSEDSDNVTKPGVCEVQPGYDWKKRRT